MGRSAVKAQPCHRGAPYFQQTSYLDLGDPFQQRVMVETPSPTAGDGSGNHWALTFMDGLGRTYRTMTKGPSASQAILVDVDFDARGNIAGQTAPYYEGDPVQITYYVYDALDRRVLTTLPDDTELPAGYGLWSSHSMDPHGHEAWSFSDAHGRVVAEERYLGGDTVVTSYGYDLLGRLVSMQDAAGNSWSWEYDSLGRLLEKNDPDAGTWSFTYDAAGRLLTQTDAKSQLTEIGYDTGGRLETKTIGGQTTTFVYGEARSGFFNEGALTSVVSPVDALRYDYDELGRVVKETRSFEGQDYVLERRYDGSGFLRGVTYPDGDAIGTPSDPLVYDAAGRLKAIPSFVSEVVYDALGRPTQIANLNGTTTTKTYSPERGWLTGIETTGPSTIQQLGYGYDSDGGGLLDLVTSPVTGEAWSYGYDDLHRMTDATNISSPSDSQSFSYDLVGNMTYNSRIGTYEYPPAGSVRPHGPAFVNGSPLSYDSNGNLLEGQGRTITWNAENLPSQITASGGSASFVYGGLGDRLKKAGTASTSVTPFGDDYEITDGVVTKYVSVPGLGVIAKRVGTGGSAQTFWLHTDHLGSIQAITDVSASEVYRRTYRPYGETIAAAGSHEESRGWIDQRQDPETGLTYLHARYYDPSLGVFLSPDPLDPYVPGVGVNRYGYGFGRPLQLSDRSGLGETCTLYKGTMRWAGRVVDTWSDRMCEAFNAPVTQQVLVYNPDNPHPPAGPGSRRPGLGDRRGERRTQQEQADAGTEEDTEDTDGAAESTDDDRGDTTEGAGYSWDQAQQDGLSWNEWWNHPATTAADQLNAETLQPDPSFNPVDLVAAAVTIGPTGVVQVSRSMTLFGKGSSLNSGQWFRVGHSSYGRYTYFSIRGRLVDLFKGREGAHIDLWKLWRRGRRP